MFESRIVPAAPGGSFFSTKGNSGLGTVSLIDTGIVGSFTISARVRINNPPSVGAVSDIFRASSFNPNTAQIALQLVNDINGLTFRGEVSGPTSSSPVNLQQTNTLVTPGRWYNITFLKAGTSVVKFFVNGVEDANAITSSVALTLFTFHRLSFGFDSRGINENFDGDIDSLAIWNTALTGESIKAIYNNGWSNLDLRKDHPCYRFGDSLTHWWRFGQGAQSTSVGDSFVSDWGNVGSGIPLDFVQGTVASSDILSPKFPQTAAVGNSLLFNEDGFLRSQNPRLLGISGVFTLSLWVNVRELLAEQNTILYIGPESPSLANAISITIDGTQAGNPLIIDIKSKTGAGLASSQYSNVVDIGEWTNLILTFDASRNPKLGFFKNNAVPSGFTLIDQPGTRSNSGVFLEVGGSTKKVNPETNFKGQIGHIGIWDKVLDQDELTFIYSQGYFVDLRYNNISYQSAENLKRYYKLGEDTVRKGRDFVDTLKGDDFPLSVESIVEGSVISVGNSPRQSGSPAQPV